MSLISLLRFPAVLLTLLLFAACGQSSDSPDTPGVELAVKVQSGTVPEGAKLIDQKNLKFLPNEVTLSSGEPLYLRNSEATPHTVTVNGRNVTGPMLRDDVMVWTAPGPGTYKITCDYHPQMKATVTVQ